MPKFIDFLYQNMDVQGTKDYWGKLAEEGFAQELKKTTINGKGKAKGGKNAKGGVKPKCNHCDKIIGKKVAIQCDGCKNMNLVECLTSIPEDRMKDFKLGNDKFVCRKCVMGVADVVPADAPYESAGTQDIKRLESDILIKEKVYSDLKAKSDLVSKSFDQVTKKIETIEQDYGVAQNMIESQKLKIHLFEEKIINLKAEKENN